MIYKNVKPTLYKGIHFRSQLEARWAVFFDLRGLDWVYEPTTFELMSGLYIPDFKVEGMYCEVKPDVEIEIIWLLKLEQLCKITNRISVLLKGGPGFTLHRCFYRRWLYKQLFDTGSIITHEDAYADKYAKWIFTDEYQLDVVRTRNHKF